MSVSFGSRVLPTKIELIRLKRSLAVSKAVHKILEDKREVLLKRLDEMIERAKKAREAASRPLFDAYRSLYDAYMRMGPLRLESTALNTPSRLEVDVKVMKVIDIEVPVLKLREKESGLTYGFADTSSALDRAAKEMRDALPLLCRAAEAECSVFRVAKELEKTQRLINTLEYVIIPSYEDSIKFISSRLEETSREEFVRLKHFKKMLERRRVGV